MMVRRFLSLILLGSMLGSPSATAQRHPSAEDQQLAAAIGLIRSGDMEAAVHALSKAAQALEKFADRTHELTRAYLYLGVAYLELGQVQLAHAKFLDALVLSPHLQLDSAEFSRKVIREFDLARARAPRVSASSEKRSSKTLPILVGLGAAGAIGVAVAAGGDSPVAPSSSNPSATPSPSPSPALSGSRDIAFLGSTPPPGSSIALSLLGALPLRVQASLILDRSVANASLYVHEIHPGGAECVCGGGIERFSITAGQALTRTEMLNVYPCVDGSVHHCPSIPFASTGLKFLVLDNDLPMGSRVVLDEVIAVNYTFTP